MRLVVRALEQRRLHWVARERRKCGGARASAGIDSRPASSQFAEPPTPPAWIGSVLTSSLASPRLVSSAPLPSPFLPVQAVCTATFIMLFAVRNGWAPGTNKQASLGKGLNLEDRGADMLSGDPMGMTFVDVLAAGSMGHIIAAGMILGLNNMAQ